MKSGYTVKVITCLLWFGVFVSGLLNWGQLVGFRDGIRWGSRPGFEVQNETPTVSTATGPAVSDVYTATYAVITLCLCIFAAVKWFESNLMLRVISIIPLVIALYKYWQLMQWKRQYLELHGDLGYFYWIVNSLPFDWFCVVSISVLLLIQSGPIIGNCFISEKQKYNL